MSVVKDIAASLGLSTDVAPLQIANEALILLGVKQGDLTPVSAFDVNLADWHGHIQRGDHIIVRDNSHDPIEHHAIFCGRQGDGGPTMIADMWGENKETARIRLRPFGDLLKGRSQLLVVRYDADKSSPIWREFSCAFAVDWAKFDGDRELYSVLNNNCDHFATFCRTFRSGSVVMAHMHVGKKTELVPCRIQYKRLK